MDNTELTMAEQMDLSQLMSNQGYKVFVKVMEQELRKLEVTAIYNVKDDSSDAVLANRARTAKAAAVFYTAVVGRLEREAQLTKLDTVIEPYNDVSAELLDVI